MDEKDDNPIKKEKIDYNNEHKQKGKPDKDFSAKQCTLCYSIGEAINAVLICKQEQIYLCNSCGKRHQIQHSTQSHTVVDIEKEIKSVLVCEVCEGLNEKVPAHGYCKTCEDPEYMCLSCSGRHTASNMFASHIINTDLESKEKHFASNTESAQAIDPTGKEFKCSLCDDYGECNAASCFCISCEKPEPFCTSCGRHHIRQKNMRDHSLSADMEVFSSFIENNIVQCELCLLDGEHNYATFFCLTCQEPEALCKKCATQHIRQRKFRNHKICNDVAQLPKKENIWCEPCTTDGSKTPANSFCKDCDDPEPLCKDCALHHIKQRRFRNHLISDDIRKFPLKPDQNFSVLCAFCKEEGMYSEASCFCQDCDDQEPFCPKCARQHIRQKNFRGHKICEDASLLRTLGKEKVFCDTCKIDGNDVLADAYCKDCSDPELFCNSCAGYHVKQKQFRNHEICRDISFLIKLQKPDDIACNICTIDGKHAKATKYCNDCDEHLCIECGDIHLKFSPEHLLTDTISNSVTCQPCIKVNKSASAISFCENCNEPMCTVCSENHLQQISYRDHTICSNMHKYFKRKLEKANEGERLEIEDMPQKNKKRNVVETKKMILGKPSVLKIKTDSVELCWETLEEEMHHYQIRYKSIKGNDKWKFCNTNPTLRFTVSGLVANTPYIFQVRSVANNIEGDYSEQSDPIHTTGSLAIKMLKFSIKQTNTDPEKYQLPAKENTDASYAHAKTRHLILGNPSNGCECEKTIMLVGETGSGKSTLVDGFINYILDVSFEDPFRFTLVNLEHDEKKTENQAESQTEWITVYKIPPEEGSRLDYTLNVIDTPGFGDTRGIQRDNAIFNQIREFFSAEGKQSVSFIDAVCFIVKAPDARLTASQSYIFHLIMSIFGKDIESNICTLITFADSTEPPVLSCLKAANVPFGSWFPFNNYALFTSNKNLQSTSLSSLFWDMNFKSFHNFFEKMKTLSTKSLMLTKAVLKQRKHLQSLLRNIQTQVNSGLLKLNKLQKTLSLYKKNQNDIKNNKDFTYESEITKQIKLELPTGQHVTNCLICNMSCHENCTVADDDKKSRCSIMDSEGNCMVCRGKCHWKEHKTSKYILTYVTETKTETYQEKKKLYENAKREKLTNEKYLKQIESDIDCVFDTISGMMDDMAICKNRLEEIALRSDPLFTVEHIDQMIQAEEKNKQVGYEQRIKMLNEFKQFAQIDQKVESFGKDVKEAKDDLSKTIGKKVELKVFIDRLKSMFSV